MTQTRDNGGSIHKNALPTRFGRLQEIRNITEQKKLRRLVRKAGFRKRSGHAIDKLIEAGTLAKCTGSKSTLEASEAIKDASINCKASNSTLSRAYGHSEEWKTRELGWGITRGFRLGRGKVWLIDGTFIHVHGGNYECAEEGWDSTEKKVALGYLLISIYDLTSREPIFQVLLPGNASEKKRFKKIVAEAMETTGYTPKILVFDRGYLSKANLKWLDDRGILWVSAALQEMNVSRKSRTHKPKTWFEHYELGKLVGGYWRGYGSLNLVKDDTIKDNKVVDVRYLIGSSGLSPEAITRLYEHRWKIEEYHKQIRELGLNKLPTVKFDGIRLHVILVALAYILLHSFAKRAKLIVRGVKRIIRELHVAQMIFLRSPS